MMQRVAACCSVLQRDAVNFVAVQCIATLRGCCAACCSMLKYVAVCCSVLHCVALCCSVLQHSGDLDKYSIKQLLQVLQCIVEYCTLLQRVAAC